MPASECREIKYVPLVFRVITSYSPVESRVPIQVPLQIRLQARLNNLSLRILLELELFQ